LLQSFTDFTVSFDIFQVRLITSKVQHDVSVDDTLISTDNGKFSLLNMMTSLNVITFNNGNKLSFASSKHCNDGDISDSISDSLKAPFALLINESLLGLVLHFMLSIVFLSVTSSWNSIYNSGFFCNNLFLSIMQFLTDAPVAFS